MLIFNVVLGKVVLYKDVTNAGLVSIDGSSGSNFGNKDINSFLISALGLFLRFREEVLESLC